MLRESGERSITIAPEAGSDRLRRVINKTVTNQEILDAAELIFANGMENLKLYYMIGLPTETDDDLVGDSRSDRRHARVDDAARPRERGRVGRIVGSVNPLIPKPGTAYQWLPMEDPADHRAEEQAAAAAARRHRQRLLQHQVGAAFVLPGAAVARRSPGRAGDRGRRAQRRQLARRRRGVRRRRGLLHLPRPIRRPVLPWDIIDGGMKAAFFKSEFEKGLREEWTLPPKRQKENLAPPAGAAVASRRRLGSRRSARSDSAYACRISSRIRSWPWHPRSAEAARSCGARR